MRQFVIVGHRAATSGDFSLDDMPGSGGRIDILARCVTAAFLTSFNIRRDTRVRLVLLGQPDPPKSIRLEGAELRYLNPDERSTGALIRIALTADVTHGERASTRGIYVQRASLREVLLQIGEESLFYLDENGTDLRDATFDANNATFVLGDHLGLLEEEEVLIAPSKRISVGPVKLHTDHCITIAHNEMDKRCSKQ